MHEADQNRKTRSKDPVTPYGCEQGFEATKWLWIWAGLADEETMDKLMKIFKLLLHKKTPVWIVKKLYYKYMWRACSAMSSGKTAKEEIDEIASAKLQQQGDLHAIEMGVRDEPPPHSESSDRDPSDRNNRKRRKDYADHDLIKDKNAKITQLEAKLAAVNAGKSGGKSGRGKDRGKDGGKGGDKGGKGKGQKKGGAGKGKGKPKWSQGSWNSWSF